MNKIAKIRPLYIAKILFEMTDEDHLLSTTDIIKILKEKYGIDGYRISVASDIELLVAFGMEIKTVKSSSNLYHLVSREFDIPELKLLIDAVASSKFITEKKSNELVSKLGKLAGQYQSEKIKRNLVPEGRIKPNNEYIYYIVDAINDAINAKKKISFQYYKYNVHKEKEPRHNGEIYVFSPYHLVWNGDYYYVIGYSEKHGEIGNFRVDRICNRPDILDDDAFPTPDDFDLNRYINTNFRMYASESQKVELICDNSVIDSLIDRFGEDIDTEIIDENTFKATVDISVNHIFYSWVFGFGGAVRINTPKEVKNGYYKMIDAEYNRKPR